MGMTACFQTITSDSFDQLKNNPALIGSFAEGLFYGEPSGEFCQLEKSWQVIHYLISGEVWEGTSPQSQIILGGTEIGEDLGYGPARYHDPQQVKYLADSIREIRSEHLEQRFDPTAMERADLYAFSAEYPEDELEMAREYFEDLKGFYLSAAERGDAVLAFMI